ncbi:MAG: hypothetical protein GY796_02125 [Chloroflexi bacterium]|nr:hypothetical protein [Chloroflexota bacterium]
MTVTAPNFGENVLNLGTDAGTEGSFVLRATDPNILPQPYSTPGDFAAQYPTPLDPTEIIAMCEEVTAWNAIPSDQTSLQQHTWRELNEMAFVTGSNLIAFTDGECPEEYSHDGTNTTVTLKNIGAKKSLSLSDIMHSSAVASAGWNGINRLGGGLPSGEGVPGGSNTATFAQQEVANVKEKEIRLAMTLTMNGWDRLLVKGDATTRPLEFNGLENEVTESNGSHTNSPTPSGTFSSQTYDRFLAESCAKPTHIFGNPQAIQEMLSGYFQLGYQGSQVVNFQNGDRITPGFNFAAFVNTGIGKMGVVADNNFTNSAASGTTFLGRLFGLRMSHNGIPLVYRLDQIPFHLNDLVPGCSAISFMVWAKTALIVKHRCAHSNFTALFTGNITTTCPVIG